MGAPTGVPLPRTNGRADRTAEVRGRLLVYSPDSYGLGHLRRCVNVATGAVRRMPGLEVILVSGSPRATIFPVPERVDVVKVPSVTRDDDGHDVPRTLRGGLEPVLAVRARILEATVEAWRPDVLLVDHHPLGVGGELAEVLPAARRRGALTVLGLRDVIDEPGVVRAAFAEPAVRDALSAYDRVCVYGARDICDPGEEYDLPADVRHRLEFTGYLSRPARSSSVRPLSAGRPQVLVTLGGGEDGAEGVECALGGLELGAPTWDTVLVLGPLMDERLARHFKRRGRRLPGVDVHTFYADLPRLMSESDAVVAMGGYSTVAEILESGVPSLLVPRRRPRREQEIRAGRLADAGLVRQLEDRSPEAFRREVEEALAWRPDRSRLPSLEGCARMSWLLESWLGSRSSTGVAS